MKKFVIMYSTIVNGNKCTRVIQELNRGSSGARAGTLYVFRMVLDCWLNFHGAII